MPPRQRVPENRPANLIRSVGAQSRDLGVRCRGGVVSLDESHPDDPISKKAVKEIEACRRRLEKIIGGVKPKPTGPTLKFPPPQRPI